MKTNTKQYLSAFGVVIIATLVGAFATLNLTFLKGFENAASDIRISALHLLKSNHKKLFLPQLLKKQLLCFSIARQLIGNFLLT